MKNLLKLIFIAMVAVFLFACESDSNDDTSGDTASIQISNLSANPARVWIYNSASSSNIMDDIPANGSKIVIVEDGVAGLNVNGGRAIIDYTHIINSEMCDQYSVTYADLSPNIAAYVTIDNAYGCLDIESYSQSAEMWVIINDGPLEVIPIWGDLTKFYDPVGVSVTKTVDYNGYTLFAGSTAITVVEDNYSRLDIHPDAGCIWINNISTTFYITEVYLSPSSDPTWGSNDLYTDISPGEFFTWSCTPEMEWDIKVVDDWDVFVQYNIPLDTDEVYTYDYTGFRATRNPNADSDKLNNAAKTHTTITNPRCEPNNFSNSQIPIISSN